jgi:hypothetical protein
MIRDNLHGQSQPVRRAGPCYSFTSVKAREGCQRYLLTLLARSSSRRCHDWDEEAVSACMLFPQGQA